MDHQKHKYFKTYHLPWTQSSTSDDKILTKKDITKDFYNLEDVYASIKYDGECTTIGRGYSHARSIDSKDHWSRKHIKQLAIDLYKDIEPGWRICGENMLATHSIKYNELESFFYVFSVWDDTNTRLSLDEMNEYCDFLGLTTAKVLKRGPFRSFYFGDNLKLDLEKDEGYIISNSDRFHHSESKSNLAKFVRKNHVETDETHWMSRLESNDVKNKLANGYK